MYVPNTKNDFSSHINGTFNSNRITMCIWVNRISDQGRRGHTDPQMMLLDIFKHYSILQFSQKILAADSYSLMYLNDYCELEWLRCIFWKAFQLQCTVLFKHLRTALDTHMLLWRDKQMSLLESSKWLEWLFTHGIFGWDICITVHSVKRYSWLIEGHNKCKSLKALYVLSTYCRSTLVYVLGCIHTTFISLWHFKYMNIFFSQGWFIIVLVTFSFSYTVYKLLDWVKGPLRARPAWKGENLEWLMHSDSLDQGSPIYSPQATGSPLQSFYVGLPDVHSLCYPFLLPTVREYSDVKGTLM